jgi:hypothetical protein
MIFTVIWDLAPHDISILLYILGKKPVSQENNPVLMPVSA